MKKLIRTLSLFPHSQELSQPVLEPEDAAPPSWEFFDAMHEACMAMPPCLMTMEQALQEGHPEETVEEEAARLEEVFRSGNIVPIEEEDEEDIQEVDEEDTEEGDEEEEDKDVILEDLISDEDEKGEEEEDYDDDDDDDLEEEGPNQDENSRRTLRSSSQEILLTDDICKFA